MVSNTGHMGGGFKRYAHPAGPLYYVLEGMTTVTTTTPICWGSLLAFPTGAFGCCVGGRVHQHEVGNNKEKNTKAKTSFKNSIDLRNSEHGNPSGKSIQNRLKMLRWRCLGHALGLPGASQGPIPNDFRRQLKIDLKIGAFCEAPGPSRELPGDPEINEKLLACGQNALQKLIICRCLCTKPFSTIFA